MLDKGIDDEEIGENRGGNAGRGNYRARNSFARGLPGEVWDMGYIFKLLFKIPSPCGD